MMYPLPFVFCLFKMGEEVNSKLRFYHPVALTYHDANDGIDCDTGEVVCFKLYSEHIVDTASEPHIK